MTQPVGEYKWANSVNAANAVNAVDVADYCKNSKIS